MTQYVYEAAVYTREVSYRNFKGEEKSAELHFALDPLQLLQLLADGLGGNKRSKSGNPIKAGKPVEVTDGEQIQFIRDLAVKAAGFPSDDGESWDPFEEFEDSIAGKAFLTKLTSSEGDRKEFSEKVILDPFRAFVGYALSDDTNSDKEKKEFEDMLKKIERVFSETSSAKTETFEERRARLQEELNSLPVAD